MAVLSDNIEKFIKSMMDDYHGMIELQRNELADYFSCAPSQINYVLATRFSPEKGYIIESRRGGGGYIRVVRLKLDDRHDRLLALIREKLGKGSISQRDAETLISGLLDTEIIDKTQARLLRATVSEKALQVPVTKDRLRASILKEMLLALLAEEDD